MNENETPNGAVPTAETSPATTAPELAADQKPAIANEGLQVVQQLMRQQQYIQMQSSELNRLTQAIVIIGMTPINNIKDAIRLRNQARAMVPFIQYNPLLSDAAYLLTTPKVKNSKGVEVDNPKYITDADIAEFDFLRGFKKDMETLIEGPKKQAAEAEKQQVERQKAMDEAKAKLPAQKAYETYWESQNFKTPDGKDYTTWDKLDEATKHTWYIVTDSITRNAVPAPAPVEPPTDPKIVAEQVKMSNQD